LNDKDHVHENDQPNFACCTYKNKRVYMSLVIGKSLGIYLRPAGTEWLLHHSISLVVHFSMYAPNQNSDDSQFIRNL
jgi:hypothetical protein